MECKVKGRRSALRGWSSPAQRFVNRIVCPVAIYFLFLILQGESVVVLCTSAASVVACS